MAAHDHTRFRELLHALILPELIEVLARKTGWFQRKRVFDPVVFVWTLILGFSCSPKRTLASLHRSYQRHSGSDVSNSAFYQRLNPPLLELMEAVLKSCMRPLGGSMGAFEDILAIDATLVRLYKSLASKFPSTTSGQAAAKLHVVMSLADMTPNRVKIRMGSEHDTAAWKSMGKWVAGRLLLMDLGYYSFWLFHRIHAHRGFFLSRLKKNCALVIKADLRTGPGRRARVQGLPLKQALELLKSKTFEFIVEVPVELRSGRTVTYQWRALGERNDETGEYHVYLTNAPAKMLMCEDARELYRLRWQVELLFKGLKQCARLHELPSNDPVIVKLLVVAALCWVCLAGLLREVVVPTGELVEVGVLRTAQVLREWGDALLGAVASQRESFTPRDSLELFRQQLRDPNDMRERAFAIPALVDYSCGSAA